MTAGATIVVSSDLMDRSKVAAALPDAVVVRSAAAAVEVADDAALVIVDLRLVDPADLADLVDRAERVVAFGSHVDEQALAAAGATGAEALARSVFFRRLTDGTL